MKNNIIAIKIYVAVSSTLNMRTVVNEKKTNMFMNCINVSRYLCVVDSLLFEHCEFDLKLNKY